MRFEQLRYLEAALENGSLRRAAGVLGVSQPTMSAQIQRLEEDLGVVLVHRGAQGVRPTFAGEAILSHVRAALRTEEALRAEVDAVNGLRSGRVSIGTISAASRGMLPPTVAEFRRTYPNVQFQVSEVGARTVREGVAAGRFDLGILTRFESDADPAGLRYIDLRAGRIVLAIPTQHRLAQVERVRIEDLADEPMVVMAEGTLLHEAYELLAEEVSVQPVYFINTNESTQDLVVAGVGLALASTLAPSTRSRPGVVLAPIDARWASTRMSIVLRADEQPSPAARQFLSLLRSSNVNTEFRGSEEAT